MRHLRWRALYMATLVVALVAALAGCALGGSPATSKPGAALPAVLVSSVISGSNSAQFSTMRVAALDPSNGAVRWSYQASRHP